jgi:hemerythrin-like domain-containing protein
MKATLFLRKDHERLHELFANFRNSKATPQNGKRVVFDAIRRELAMHSDIEKELFYPALKMSSSHQAEGLVETAMGDHRRIEAGLDEITSGLSDSQFESRALQLIELVEAHIATEEDELLAEARRSLSEQRLEELGLEMEQRKRMLSQVAA